MFEEFPPYFEIKEENEKKKLSSFMILKLEIQIFDILTVTQGLELTVNLRL